MFEQAMDAALDRRAFLATGLSCCAAPLIQHRDLVAGHTQTNTGPAPDVFPPMPELALRYGAARRGIRYGAAVRGEMLREEAGYGGFLLAECSSITPEWSMKWESLAYSDPEYDFSDCDQIVNFARRHGVAVRGHALLWHLSVPGWARARIAETGDWQIVEDHIRLVVARYGDAVDQWDVVNEPIDAYGTDGLRENLFFQAYGRDYIEKAIRITHEVAPHARIFINDFSLEYAFPEETGRRRALLHLAERLLNRDAPLSGIGVQAHLDLRKGPVSEPDIHAFFRAIENMGLEIAITELDVREDDITLPVERRDGLVSDAVRRYLDIALQYSSVTSLTTWGLSDAFSWLVEAPYGHPWNRGLPYDHHWAPKPMRAAIAQVLT